MEQGLSGQEETLQPQSEGQDPNLYTKLYTTESKCDWSSHSASFLVLQMGKLRPGASEGPKALRGPYCDITEVMAGLKQGRRKALCSRSRWQQRGTWAATDQPALAGVKSVCVWGGCILTHLPLQRNDIHPPFPNLVLKKPEI